VDGKNVSDIITEFESRRSEVDSKSSDMTVSGVAHWVKTEIVNISPDFQRRDRWDDTRRSRLIESFLVNIPVPPVYLNSEGSGPYTVIDGKQRITAVHKFVNEGMKLTNLEFLQGLEGLGYEDLPADIRSKLEIEPAMRTVTVTSRKGNGKSDGQVKYRVFHRLNTGGIKLEPQEIRNAIYRGPLNDLIVEMSSNVYMQEQMKTAPDTAGYEKMKDLEYVLRFLTMLENWQSINDEIKNLMDRFMEENSSPTKKKINEWRKTYQTMSYRVERIFGDAAFRNWNHSSESWRDQQNVAVYDAQTVAVSLLTSDEFDSALERREEIIEDLAEMFAEDVEFNDSVSKTTSSQARIEYRISAVYDLLIGE